LGVVVLYDKLNESFRPHGDIMPIVRASVSCDVMWDLIFARGGPPAMVTAMALRRQGHAKLRTIGLPV
jgi:hypothetical protein